MNNDGRWLIEDANTGHVLSRDLTTDAVVDAWASLEGRAITVYEDYAEGGVTRRRLLVEACSAGGTVARTKG